MNGRTQLSGRGTPLNILALAPLPYLQDGAPAFEGGGSVFYAELLPRLAWLGHCVRVIAEAPPPQNGAARVTRRWDEPNLAVEGFVYEHRSSLSPPTAALRERTSLAIRRVFDRLVADRRPDVVLIGREITTLYVLERCRHHQLPAVVISHGVAPWALLEGLYPASLAHEVVEGLCAAESVVAIAAHVGEMLRRLGVTRVDTIPNVADTGRFSPQPRDPRLLDALRLSPTQPVVGHVSVLRRAKRPLDIVDSAARVLRARPDVVYVVVGDGPCRHDMEERAQRLGVAESFRFVGEVGHEDVPSYMNLFDMVVLSSEREGQSLAGLEAQASGRVLLATDIVASREIIVDGETGVLFRTGDVSDLTAKTLALIDDRGLREAIGRRGRAAAERRDAGQWGRAYGEVLRRVAMRGPDRVASPARLTAADVAGGF
jgi:glycosyltransferase involved in cell wall biosynthesis